LANVLEHCFTKWK